MQPDWVVGFDRYAFKEVETVWTQESCPMLNPYVKGFKASCAPLIETVSERTGLSESRGLNDSPVACRYPSVTPQVLAATQMTPVRSVSVRRRSIGSARASSFAHSPHCG